MSFGSSLKKAGRVVKKDALAYAVSPYAGLAKGAIDYLHKPGSAGMVNHDASNRANDYQAEVDKINGVQSGEDADRTAALAQAGGIDPGFEQQLNNGYNVDLQNQMAGLNAGYTNNMRAEGLNAAKRGVLGGSNDAEHQANLAAQFQSGTMNAVQGAQTRRAGLRNNQLQSQSAFRRSVLAGDPAMAQYYQQQAQQQGQAMTNAQQQQAFMQTFGQIRNNGQDALSRGYGGAASAIGNGYSAYNGALQ